jgi:hypothetical protein
VSGGSGSAAGSTVALVISDSAVTGGTLGVAVVLSGRASAQRSTFSGSQIAIFADNGGVVSLGGNLIAGNETGIQQQSTGVVESLGNNMLRNNTTAVSGTVTTFAPI